MFGQTWSWNYLNNDWLSQQTDASRVTVNYTLNARGIVTGMVNSATSGGSTLSSYAVNSFAPVGSVSQIVSSIPSASALGGTTNYTQDTRSEVTNESSTAGGGYTLNCAYDAAENSTTFRGAAQSFNADNQNSAYVYDGSGNPTAYRGTTATFDAENRMTAFGTAMTAGYRADGLRASKTTASGTTYFIYDGDDPVLELNASGTKTAVTTFGPTGALARTTSTRTLLYTSDYQGNVSQQIDTSSGSVVASYAFDSFGSRAVSSSDPTATSDPYSGYGGTMGYFTDWETGLQLLGHRYYDSGVGRFLNRDPMDTGGGINVYGYVSNNPLEMADPSGYEGAGHGGGGGAGGGVSHGGAGEGPGWPKGPWRPGPEQPTRGAGGKFRGGLAGCAFGALAAALTTAYSGGEMHLDWPTLCPIVVGCLAGGFCSLAGGCAGGGVQGCVVGAICGGVTAAIGQLCAHLPGCGGTSHNWDNNDWCQVGVGIVSGCIGGLCGPPCGVLGTIAGGGLGIVCNKYVH